MLFHSIQHTLCAVLVLLALDGMLGAIIQSVCLFIILPKWPLIIQSVILPVCS